MKIDRLGFFWDPLGMNNYLKKFVVSGELQEKNLNIFRHPKAKVMVLVPCPKVDRAAQTKNKVLQNNWPGQVLKRILFCIRRDARPDGLV